jgi:hypothetical protein
VAPVLRESGLEPWIRRRVEANLHPVMTKRFCAVSFAALGRITVAVFVVAAASTSPVCC